MHPDAAFRFADEAAMRAFVEAHVFAHVFVITPDGPRIAKYLDGATVLTEADVVDQIDMLSQTKRPEDREGALAAAMRG